MTDFNSFGLPATLSQALARMNFVKPTPIQEQSIPHALEGRDILGSAQTGTGKTGAFGIPLMVKLLNSPRGSALVMTPTRELATQVMDSLTQMAGNNPMIRTALIIGGESMPKQIQQLRQRPRLIVGTPGRIIDHLERGTMMLHDTGYLVLDETDRMLDLGFAPQLEKIVKFLPKSRQTLLFSATLPANIVKLSAQYLTDPVRVAAGNQSAPATNVKQEAIKVSDSEKYPRLLDELSAREGSIIVFVKTKWGADKMAVRLRKAGHNAEAIHGDLAQNRRERVIDNFRNKKYRVLVATDIAARGLDIPHIEHVINYDLPQVAEDYIHRIGRTARNGAEGEAICLITPDDGRKWAEIDRLLNPNAPRKPHHEQRKHEAGSGKGGNNKPRQRNRSRWRGNRSQQPKAA